MVERSKKGKQRHNNVEMGQAIMVRNAEPRQRWRQARRQRALGTGARSSGSHTRTIDSTALATQQERLVGQGGPSMRREGEPISRLSGPAVDLARPFGTFCWPVKDQSGP